MRDLIVTTVQSVARGWKDEAKRRRNISATDPIADTLEWCAGEVEQQLHTIETAAPALTVEQFARQHGVTSQTVRGWCRDELLPGARMTPKGWEIPADARKVRASARKIA